MAHWEEGNKNKNGVVTYYCLVDDEGALIADIWLDEGEWMGKKADKYLAAWYRSSEDAKQAIERNDPGDFA